MQINLRAQRCSAGADLAVAAVCGVRCYFAGADLVSVFVAGAAGVVLALELESEPLELDDSLVLLVVVSLVEPEVEPPVVPVVELAEVPDVAVLPEVALSVL